MQRGSVRSGSLWGFAVSIALLPAMVFGTTIDRQARSARSIAVAACRNGNEAGVASSLAKRLGVSEARLEKALRRLNSEGQPQKRWCDLTSADFREILSDATRPNEELSESREEWQRFTIGDENGVIAPGGLRRALEQRKALTRGTSDALHREINSTGLPGSPSGWTNVTGYIHPVGRINALLVHPTSTNTMWAGADGGGIWKTTDGGTTWQAANDFLASLSVSSFAMRPADPMTIYAATGAQGSHTATGGAGVFKSIDGGTTWSPLSATDPTVGADWQFVYQLAIHPSDSNTVMAATSGGAYITTNGGGIWTKIAAASTRARNVAIHPANANLRVIAMDNGTVEIATDGSTYNPYTIAGVTGSSYTRIALAPSNQNIMYALVNNSGTTQLYRSATGGTAWSAVTSPVNVFYNGGYLSFTGGLWVDPTNANHIAVAEGWSAVTSDASVPSPAWSNLCCGWTDFHGMTGHPGYNGSTNKTVFFFDDGGLYRWTDVDTVAGTSPSYLAPNGAVVTEAYSVAGRGGNLVFGAQDVGARIFMTASGDATQKWRFTTFSYSFTRLFGDGGTAAADRTNPNTLYGSLQYLTLQRSLDGGTTSQLICQGITDISCNPTATPALIESGNAAFIAPFVLDPNNQSRMLAGAASLWRSNDVSSGTPPSWSAIHTGVGSVITAIAVAPTDSNIIWVAYQNGSVYKTGNGTAVTPSWTPVATVPAGNKLRIYIDRTNANHVYIGLSGFLANRLVATPDGGTNWSPVTGLPSASVFAIQQHPSVATWLYVGTAVGLFASPDGGTTWSASNEGPANVQVRDLTWYSESGSSAVLLVGTFGRGIWRATVDSAVSLAAPTGLVATGASSMVCAPPPPDPGASTRPEILPAIDWPPCSASVSLTWNAVAGATGYKIYRSSSLFSYAQIGTSGGPSYTDGTASPGAAYLYMVRATDGSNDSSNSNADLATAVAFSDPSLSGMTVRALHISQLRSAVDAVRILAAMGAGAYTDPSLNSTITIQRAHLTELRSGLDSARSTLALPALVYTDPTITVQSTFVKAVHINELRDGVK
jgi:hypothetical protein